MKGRFLLHYCDPVNWRLRNTEKHPFDPGWEVGSYSICHRAIRSNVNVGTWIFDVVVKDGKGIIRSAFEICKARGTGQSRVLYFDEYYFADEEPIELPGFFIQYRCMKMETWSKKYKQKPVWDKIIREYTKYERGQKPKSIGLKLWKNMLKKSPRICEKYGAEKPSSKSSQT